MRDREKDRNDLKMREKKEAATGWPSENEMIMDIEKGSTRLHSVENLLWKRPYIL